MGEYLGITDRLRDLYYGWEEKWYALLDQVDAKVPVYKVIDPIDKVIPSFLLVLAVFVLIVGFGILSLLGAGSSTVTFTVFDEDGAVLPNTKVTVQYNGVEQEYTTNEFGNVEFSVPVGIPIDTEIENPAYLLRNYRFTVNEPGAHRESVTVRSLEAATLTKRIRILNEVGQPVRDTLRVSFQCSNPRGSPPQDVITTTGEAIVEVDESCGNLIANVSDEVSFLDKVSVVIDSADKTIFLDASPNAEGELVVNVTGNGGMPLDNISVELYRYRELDANPNIGPVDFQNTSGGQVTFTKSAGEYVVKTYDPTGQYGEESSGKITVSAGRRSEQNFVLRENIIGEIKIEVLDDSNGEPVQDAIVTIRFENDNSELTTLRTNGEGRANFGISRNTTYRAEVRAENYVQDRLSGLRVGDSVNTIRLEKCTPLTCGKLKVKIVDQDGRNVSNATVTLYNAASGFLAGYGERISDLNGIAEFNGVKSGNYYAFAFKASASGRSDTAYFSTASSGEDLHLTVTMEIPLGSVEVKVVDRDNNPVPFARVTVFDSLFQGFDPLGSDFTDELGIYLLETKADKRVNVVVAADGFATYSSPSKVVLPATIQNITAVMEPRITDRDLEVKFQGLYQNGLLATVLAAGEEYTARLQLRVPEDADYEELGLHVRTGDDIILEKDELFIKATNFSTTNVIKASRYDPSSGREEQEYDVTAGDAKWANAEWEFPEAGVYEVEFTVKVRETAKVGEELNLYYRAWAVEEDGDRIRAPQDDAFADIELYTNTFKESYQIGVTTLCDEQFCFNTSVRDINEGIIESVVDSYVAKIFNPYELEFVITNNSDRAIHNNAELRITNPDESILFGTYDFQDADARPLTGTVDSYEFPRIDVGNLEPSRRVSGSLTFETQRAVNGIINLRLVSDQVVVFEKNVVIAITSPKEMKVTLSQSLFPSGIQNDFNVVVQDRANNLEIEGAVVKVKDRFGDVIASATTSRDGIAKLSVQAQKPGVPLFVEVSKPDYNVKVIEIRTEAGVLDIDPSAIGVSLNAQSRVEAENEVTLRNVTNFPVKVNRIELEGNFENLLDEDQIENWLEGSYLNLTIDELDRERITLRTFLSDEGRRVERLRTLEGSLIVTVENFGEQWEFSVPVTISIGLGEEVEDPSCLVITRSAWQAQTEGTPVSVEFEIQNNCTINGAPVPLRNLESKINWTGNQIGDYKITIGTNETELRSAYFRSLVQSVPAGERFFAILTFTPFGSVSGTAEANIEIRAHNPVDSGDQILTASLNTEINVVNLRECLSTDAHILEVLEGQSSSFSVLANDCGGTTDVELTSDLDLGIERFVLQGDDSETVEVLSQGRIPGQYPVYVFAKGQDQQQRRLLNIVRVRVHPIETCFLLNRFEFDVLDDPSNPFDGVDTAEIRNICAEKSVDVSLNERDWWGAFKDGLKWGAIVLGANILAGELDESLFDTIPSWRKQEAGLEDAKIVTENGVRYAIFRDPETSLKHKVELKEGAQELTAKENGKVAVLNEQEEEVREQTEPKKSAVRRFWDSAWGKIKGAASGVYRFFVSEEAAPPEASNPNEAGNETNGDAFPTTEQTQGSAAIPFTGLQIYRTGSSAGGGLLGGIAGSGGIVGSVNGLLDSLVGTSGPFGRAAAATIIGTIFNYYGQEEAIAFHGVVRDSEIMEIQLYEDEGLSSEDGSVTLREEGEPRSEPNASAPELDDRVIGLIFENGGLVTTDLEPHYSVMNIEGVRYEYETGEYKIQDESGFFDSFGFGSSEEESDVPFSEDDIAVKETSPISQKYRLEFNAVPPESALEPVFSLQNCQAGVRTGATGPSAVPKVAFDWKWGTNGIQADRCNEDNPDGIFCDATQFSIAVLQKVKAIDDFLQVNSNLTCPSPLDSLSTRTNSIGSFDIGLSRIMVDKAGNDVNVMVEVENTNPGSINSTLRISVRNLETGDVTQCPDNDISIRTLSSSPVGCVFNGLPDASYAATASLSPIIDCVNCENKTASDEITTEFFKGASGLQECEPYSTARLAEFLAATGISGGAGDEVLKQVNFRANLIQDRFSDDFHQDFDTYARTQSFFDAPAYYTDTSNGLGQYFRDTDLFEFAPKFGQANPEGYLLPGPGIYNVTINITYPDDSWALFQNGQPNATITVELDKADTPEPDSPFYYLPFDGPIGLDNGRVGYGVNFRGDAITLNDDTETLRTIEIAGSTPITNGTISVEDVDDFRSLNVSDRGTLFEITRGATPSMTFSPSYATPVILKMINTADEAWAFYNVGVDGAAVNVGSSLGKWNGVGSICQSFNGGSVFQDFFERNDAHGLNRNCALLSGDDAATAYGFEFCDPVEFGEMSVKSVFYTPQGKNSIMKIVAANEEVELITPDIAGQQVALNGVGNVPNNLFGSDNIDTVEDLFAMIEDEFACISGDSGRAEIWWNPKKVLETLQDQEAGLVNSCIQ